MTNEIANRAQSSGQPGHSLKAFDVLSFDCYGTLIDWESGIYTALLPLLSRTCANPSQPDQPSRAGMGRSRADKPLSRDAVLEAFAPLEASQQ
jgi:2-haloacid dehalogenase